jgi:XapX domain-containing protein
MKILLGFLLAFGIGAVCRFAGIPSPAPNAILGSLLVVSMSLGYVGAGQYLHRSRSTSSHLVTPSATVVAATEDHVHAHAHQKDEQAVTPHTMG